MTSPKPTTKPGLSREKLPESTVAGSTESASLNNDSEVKIGSGQEPLASIIKPAPEAVDRSDFRHPGLPPLWGGTGDMIRPLMLSSITANPYWPFGHLSKLDQMTAAAAVLRQLMLPPEPRKSTAQANTTSFPAFSVPGTQVPLSGSHFPPCDMSLPKMCSTASNSNNSNLPLHPAPPKTQPPPCSSPPSTFIPSSGIPASTLSAWYAASQMSCPPPKFHTTNVTDPRMQTYSDLIALPSEPGHTADEKQPLVTCSGAGSSPVLPANNIFRSILSAASAISANNLHQPHLPGNLQGPPELAGGLESFTDRRQLPGAEAAAVANEEKLPFTAGFGNASHTPSTSSFTAMMAAAAVAMAGLCRGGSGGGGGMPPNSLPAFPSLPYDVHPGRIAADADIGSYVASKLSQNFAGEQVEKNGGSVGDAALRLDILTAGREMSPEEYMMEDEETDLDPEAFDEMTGSEGLERSVVTVRGEEEDELLLMRPTSDGADPNSVLSGNCGRSSSNRRRVSRKRALLSSENRTSREAESNGYHSGGKIRDSKRRLPNSSASNCTFKTHCFLFIPRQLRSN
ncbi:hypothetical protein AAHC03_0201 [Spirometra sp. Aus1]